MKLCHSEAMKEIKELEERKRILLTQERSRCIITYAEGEKKLKPKYSYAKTRMEVDALDKKVRAIRHLLAVANCKVIIPEFDMSIGEALVYLAQLQNKAGIVQNLSSREQLERVQGYDKSVSYRECAYDVNLAESELAEIRADISRLQIAIDRANLNNYIEF